MADHETAVSQLTADEGANQPRENEANRLDQMPTEHDKEVQQLRIKNARLKLKLRMQKTLPRRASTARPERQSHTTSLRRRRNIIKPVQKPQKNEFSSALDALGGITPVVSPFSSWGQGAQSTFQFAETQEHLPAGTGNATPVEASNDSMKAHNEKALEDVVKELGETKIGK